MSIELATGRYSTFELAMGVPVATSLGRPKFSITYALDEEVGALKPWGLLGKGLSEDEFTARYRGRLDKTGVGKLQRVFHAISRKYDGARLVLLCFEDVHAGQFCHRRVFAEWWEEYTGQRVPEVALLERGDGQRVLVWDVSSTLDRKTEGTQP